jgi:hypothetical protein
VRVGYGFDVNMGWISQQWGTKKLAFLMDTPGVSEYGGLTSDWRTLSVLVYYCWS